MWTVQKRLEAGQREAEKSGGVFLCRISCQSHITHTHTHTHTPPPRPAVLGHNETHAGGPPSQTNPAKSLFRSLTSRRSCVFTHVSLTELWNMLFRLNTKSIGIIWNAAVTLYSVKLTHRQTLTHRSSDCVYMLVTFQLTCVCCFSWASCISVITDFYFVVAVVFPSHVCHTK